MGRPEAMRLKDLGRLRKMSSGEVSMRWECVTLRSYSCDPGVTESLMVAAAVATTNRRFAIAWDRFSGPLPKVRKRKLVKREPYHHRLTRITHTVNGQLVVLPPLTT